MSSHDSFAASGSSPQSIDVDLVFENYFSIFLIRPVSQTGKTWLDSERR